MSGVKEISEQIQNLRETIKRQSLQIEDLKRENDFLNQKNRALIEETKGLRKKNNQRGNRIAVESDKIQNLELIVRTDKNKSIQAIQELLRIWDDGNNGAKINSARIRLRNLMRFLNKEEVNVIYQHIVGSFRENIICDKIYNLIETLLGSEQLTDEQIEKLLNLWTLNGGPSKKNFEGLWLQSKFPNIIQRAKESKKWNVYFNLNGFDLKKKC